MKKIELLWYASNNFELSDPMLYSQSYQKVERKKILKMKLMT